MQDLFKNVVAQRPDKPLDYLIEKLQKPKVRRVLIVGPSGSNRKENALALGEYFGWTCISMGDLLKKEVSKKTELAQAI
jgi:adenylate kinase